jgi:hypothetical protein
MAGRRRSGMHTLTSSVQSGNLKKKKKKKKKKRKRKKWGR